MLAGEEPFQAQPYRFLTYVSTVQLAQTSVSPGGGTWLWLDAPQLFTSRP